VVARPPKLVVLRIGDKGEIEKYLRASENYLNDPGHRRSMKYPFPDIRADCPVCGKRQCATYRGYYLRQVFCPEMEFIGKVAIRTAFCRHRKTRFTLFPDFLIRNRRISRISLTELQSQFQRHHQNIQMAIDDWTEGLGEEFYLPLSTAHEWLSLKFAVPP
jgi:hypothetical protein